MGSGPQECLLDLARSTFEPYASRHGYDLALHRTTRSNQRPLAWGKVPILQELLASHEIVVWIDADAMIVDGRIDIATQLPDGQLMALVQHYVNGTTMPNTGVWVLRGGTEALGLMDAIWDQEDLIQHRWWENAALCRLFGYDIETMTLSRPSSLLLERTHVLDKSWNSIPDDPASSPRIRHYPGFAVNTRRALMTRDRVITGARRAMRRW